MLATLKIQIYQLSLWPLFHTPKRGYQLTVTSKLSETDQVQQDFLLCAILHHYIPCVILTLFCTHKMCHANTFL